MFYNLQGIVAEPSGKKKLGNKNVLIDGDGNQLFLDTQLEHARTIMNGPLMYSEESTRTQTVCEPCVYIYFPKNDAACTYYDQNGVKLYDTEKKAIRRNAIEHRRRLAREKKLAGGGAATAVKKKSASAPKKSQKRARTPSPTPPPVKRPRVVQKPVAPQRTYLTAAQVICDVLRGTISNEQAQDIIRSNSTLTASLNPESQNMLNIWCRSTGRI